MNAMADAKTTVSSMSGVVMVLSVFVDGSGSESFGLFHGS